MSGRGLAEGEGEELAWEPWRDDFVYKLPKAACVAVETSVFGSGPKK